MFFNIGILVFLAKLCQHILFYVSQSTFNLFDDRKPIITVLSVVIIDETHKMCLCCLLLQGVVKFNMDTIT